MKLLDQVRQVLRLKHYSYRTEQAYFYWIVVHFLHPPRQLKVVNEPTPDSARVTAGFQVGQDSIPVRSHCLPIPVRQHGGCQWYLTGIELRPVVSMSCATRFAHGCSPCLVWGETEFRGGAFPNGSLGTSP